MVTKMLFAYSKATDKNVRKIASIIIIICLVIIVTGVISVQWPYISHKTVEPISPTPTSPSYIDNNWQLWNSQSLTLYYPKNWYKIPDNTVSLVISNENISAKELVSPSGVLLILHTYTQETLPDDVKNALTEQSHAGSIVAANPFNITTITSLTIHGQAALSYIQDMSTTEDNTLNYKINYVIQANTQYVVLESLFNKALYDTYAQQVANIAQSLHIT